MSKFIIYEYNKQNKDLIVEELEDDGYGFIVPLTDKITINEDYFLNAKKGLLIDISILVSDDERAIFHFALIENLMNNILQNNLENLWHLIVNRKYTYIVNDLFGYRIEKVKSLESYFNVSIPENTNVVDIRDKDFDDLMTHIRYELVGHSKYKDMLEEELRKFRVFNKLGYQPVFSTLIMGNSGIGKTELARILHRNLSTTEPFIKINFGNYNDQNALSSLIGSPRGYVGSSKGELSDKLSNSKSNVILIDEFEKSNKSVQNFFLQLLEDGVFTDSLGRDYDLNKYMIIFTANVLRDKVAKKFSPELISRFNLVYSFSTLNLGEKEEYVGKRLEKIRKDVKEKLNIDFKDTTIQNILDFDYKKYENMRDINSQLMKRISDELYPIVYGRE